MSHAVSHSHFINHSQNGIVSYSMLCVSWEALEICLTIPPSLRASIPINPPLCMFVRMYVCMHACMYACMKEDYEGI